VKFLIKDTGIGIAEDKKAFVFKPFSQVDSSPTRKYGGVGLGLTISKRIVEKMGGTVGFESTEGEGSSFWFTARFEIPNQSESSESDAPVNINRLIEVSDSKQENLKELVDLYLQQTEQQIQQLKMAILSNELSEVKRIAHSCAGSSATCGMTALIAPLRILERFAHENRAEKAEQMIPKIDEAFEKILNFLKKESNGLSFE
jgi:HPt (histidine-containing phosphotransfer) domain-containing protein